MKPSVRVALIKALALPILALLAGGAWFSYRMAAEVANDAYNQSLQNSALAIANRVRIIRGQVRVLLPVEAEQVLRTDEFDRVYFRVRDAQGRLVTGDAGLPSPGAGEQGETATFYNGTHEGRRIRGVRLYTGAPGNRFDITVAETTRKRESAVRRLLLALVLPTALVVLGTGAMIWFGISRGLTPLRQIERELEQRGGEVRVGFEDGNEDSFALVFGAETSGLPQALLESFPPAQRLRLPMRPGNRSLNLSNAVAVVVYEAWRQLGYCGAR